LARSGELQGASIVHEALPWSRQRVQVSRGSLNPYIRALCRFPPSRIGSFLCNFSAMLGGWLGGSGQVATLFARRFFGVCDFAGAMSVIGLPD